MGIYRPKAGANSGREGNRWREGGKIDRSTSYCTQGYIVGLVF